MKNLCCKDNKDKGYNYCPECGYSLSYGKRESIPATVTKAENSHRDEEQETHPSYGQILFSRRSGSTGESLYGSSIKHKEVIHMEINRSKKYLDEFDERYYPEHRPLIEIEMSLSQFSEAISSMNMGSGVPVTLTNVMGRVMPRCQEATLRDKTDKNLELRFAKIANRLNSMMEKLEAITSKKSINKGDREAINKMYTMFTQEVRSNLPFLKQCLDEAVDDSIKQAKGEVEAFYLNRITSLGIQKAKELEGDSNFKMIE
jgi:hypothetical protein